MAANAAQPLMSDLAAVVARLREITVELRTTGRAGGSGVIWRADGLVVTSAHVVARAHGACSHAQVVLADRRPLPATLVAGGDRRRAARTAAGLPSAPGGHQRGPRDRRRPRG